jgi:hypothetical protein
MPDELSYSATNSVCKEQINGDFRPNGQDPQFRVTLFRSVAARAGTEKTISLLELGALVKSTTAAEKDSLPLFKTAIYGDVQSPRGSLRHDANVLAFTGVVADYDGEQVTFAQAVEVLRGSGLLCVVYTSPNHRVDAPRWRVVAPTSTELAPSEWNKMMRRLAGLLAFRDANGSGARQTFIADESWVLSQAYYYGHVKGRDCLVEVVGGTPIDLYNDLDQIAVDKPPPKRRAAPLQPKLVRAIKKNDASAWNGDRSRQVWYVCCSLVRAGWTDLQITDVLLDRDNGVSAHIYDQNNPAEYAARQARDAREEVEGKEGNFVAELNKTYAVIQVSNKAAILKEYTDDEDRPSFSLLPVSSFRLLLANHPQWDAAEVWLQHKARREHVGITFAPGAADGQPKGYYNLWRGWAVEASTEGSCELFKAHLRDNVCQGSEDLFRWVFGWFADIFQHPATKCDTALVLRGPMGVGKTIVGKAIGKLLGLHYAPVSDPRYITGRFNAHLLRCLLLHGDEAFWAGDHTTEGKIRDLVTGERHPIEFKGLEAFFVRNYVRLFVTGEQDWLVPAGMSERRFAVLDVGIGRKQDIEYFSAIEKELRGGGYARLLHELLAFDLEGVNLRVIPKTEALLEQKVESLLPEYAWWLDVLKAGRLPWCLVSANRCPGRILYDHYISHSRIKIGTRRRKIETAIGMFLRKIVPGLRSCREHYEMPDNTGTGDVKIEKGTVYTFPPLAACREAFDSKLQQAVGWDAQDGWEKNSGQGQEGVQEWVETWGDADMLPY